MGLENIIYIATGFIVSILSIIIYQKLRLRNGPEVSRIRDQVKADPEMIKNISLFAKRELNALINQAEKNDEFFQLSAERFESFLRSKKASGTEHLFKFKTNSELITVSRDLIGLISELIVESIIYSPKTRLEYNELNTVIHFVIRDFRSIKSSAFEDKLNYFTKSIDGFEWEYKENRYPFKIDIKLKKEL